MNIQEAEEFFYGFRNHFWDLELDNLKQFLGCLNNPQDKGKIIHIAGTNGKGSVSAYIASILIAQGYKVGRYNSPVVFHKRENITINNIPISAEQFAKYVTAMKNVIEESDKNKKLPTVFELETALAYYYFADEECDFVIMECGLGGRLDATNVTESTILSILTSIGMDHMAYLGKTLGEIALCKAGICKEGCPVVMIEQKEEAKKQIQKVAIEKNCPIYEVKKSKIKLEQTSLLGQDFNYQDIQGNQQTYHIQMLGVYQTENAALAIEAVKILNSMGYSVSDNAIRQGLKETRVNGRFQIVAEDPLFIIDGAHNPDAAWRLRENMEKLLPEYQKIFIMGVFADKEYQKIVEITCPLAKEVYTVQSNNPRALSGQSLKDCILKQGILAQNAETVNEAVQIAKKRALQLTKENKKPTAIICFGSLSYLAQAVDALDW